ncbi:hypothetical protein DYBT9275_01491 [Dyadobacter sp. CECT 9275]|uniref:Uncharacterized protein n=1 Tax=Dyadobacter helix TaxID=2822344 RepID=A0A916JAB9_9BACT|nr:hypothetical protein DYBT9275_01491 [Dyadobacter sp. CECT 9275]
MDGKDIKLPAREGEMIFNLTPRHAIYKPKVKRIGIMQSNVQGVRALSFRQ